MCGNGWIDRSTQSKWKSNYQKMDFCEECQNVKKSLKRNKPDVQKIWYVIYVTCAQKEENAKNLSWVKNMSIGRGSLGSTAGWRQLGLGLKRYAVEICGGDTVVLVWYFLASCSFGSFGICQKTWGRIHPKVNVTLHQRTFGMQPVEQTETQTAKLVADSRYSKVVLCRQSS